MTATIMNASSIPLNEQTGTVPDVGGAMTDYFQPLTFGVVTKSVDGFQAVETQTEIAFLGVIQPFTERQLILKPEGQRAWSWFTLHADPVLTLDVDDVVVFRGKQTRVMARKDYAMYGFCEYHLCQDYSASGPVVSP